MAALLTGPLLLAGCFRSETARAPVTPEASEPNGLAFTEVTGTAGLGGFRHETGATGRKWFPETMGAGGGFLDYDGDGWLDVLLVGGGTWEAGPAVPALRLYRNNTDGTFTEHTEAAGLAGLRAYGFGITTADYDNDGDTDVFLTTLAEDLLLRNDPDPARPGGRRFTEVGRAAGIAGDAAWSTAALFFDADQDGHVDLFVGRYVAWSPEADLFCSVDGIEKDYCTPGLYTGLAARYYHNDGDGTFTERTEAAGFLPAPGKTLGVAELDFNRDGWPDLAVANDLEADLLYENNGDGTFREIGLLSGIAFDEHGGARSGMGIDAGHVDESGEVSLFVGNFTDQMMSVFRHAGGGLFIDRAAASGIGRPSLRTLTFGLFLFDADLDGDLDLFAANGHVQPLAEQATQGVRYRQPAHLFVNDGDGHFTDAATEPGSVLAQPLVGRGSAYGDYDRDGDLDLFITENGGPVHLWRNDLQGAGYVRVQLEGRRSNRSALGSRVVAVVGGRRLERRVRSGSSYLSASTQAVTFGLGAAERVDSLYIYWPGGRVDRHGPVPAGRVVQLTEGAVPILASLAERQGRDVR